METTSTDVIELLGQSLRARHELEEWKRRRPQVSAHVLRHVTALPYTLTPDDVQRVARSTEHALGNVKRANVEGHPIENWSPEFALVHVLHYAIEKRQALLTYQEFRHFCATDELVRDMLWNPACEEIHVHIERGLSPQHTHDAMRWRVGNAYYSFLREMYILVYIRAAGIPLQVHPLADALFRVDGWFDHTVVAMYVQNRRFRDGDSGRKPPTMDILGEGFRLVPLRLKPATKFGVVLLPDAESLSRAVEQLRQRA